MASNVDAARDQARWMKPNASLWVRPDAARFYKPGTKLEEVFPALALKYNPNQPRVPAGNPDGGQWTDGEGGAGRLAQPMGNIGITDRRVISDADPEGVKPGRQYAQARGGGRGRGGGSPNDLTPAQAARLVVVRSQSQEAIARVHERDPDWKPTPSVYESASGMIRAYEADAAQAQMRLKELAASRLAPGPFVGETVVSSGKARPTAAEREAINRIGRETGCHSCGTKESGRPDGNFTPDHQPPTALNWSRGPQLLIPHCATCSAKQGSAVRDFPGRRR